MSSLPPNNISIDDITNYLSNIDGSDIQDVSITNAKISSSGIDCSKITTGTIHIDRINNNSITNIKLATNYAARHGNNTYHFESKYFTLDEDWWIITHGDLKNLPTGKLDIDTKGWDGDSINDDDLVFTRKTDESSVWIRADGTDSLDAINMTGQHGLFSLNKDLKNNIGYICCVSSEGYWNEEQKFSYKNKKKYININDTLPMIKLSNKKYQKSVIGIISNKRQDFNVTRLRHINTYKEKAIVVNSLGEGAIWVSNFNGNLENGDYITSSDIPGIGMKQDDDILHNYTVAKITMDCDFNPQYIPIEKMKNNTSNIILDDNDNIIYEYEYDEQNNIKYDYEYETKYIRLNGDIIDKLTYDNELSSNLPVYKMAFVGCTYHCG